MAKYDGYQFHVFANVHRRCGKCGDKRYCVLVRIFRPVNKKADVCICYKCLLSDALEVCERRAGAAAMRARVAAFHKRRQENSQAQDIVTPGFISIGGHTL